MKSILPAILFFFIFSLSGNFYVLSQGDSLSYPRIGLVFGGGGAKGLAHIGVLKVLEEAGIQPDYIGGTSMGAIVAGLYAIGYPTDSIENLARTIPWSFYLGDKIPRRDITIEEKEDMDRFVLSFPLKEKKILSPTGIINGQNIENMLNRLCAPVSEIRDFSRFSIPFLCIATDIENGAEVVLKEGYLPRALRASMSIPSYFSPVEINNRLLVDGGLVNNFPAQRVKEMGADIIIGVDLGYYGYSREELNSMIRIIQHSLFLTAEKMNAKNREVCDILITPELMKYNSSSFYAADTIIKGGEIAARKHMLRLRLLADSINRMKASDITIRKIPVPDTFKFDEIVLEGLEKVTPGLVFGKLQLSALQKVTPADLEKAIGRVYSSLYFDHVTYEIKHTDNGTKLIVTLKETKGGLLRVGIHYDSYNKSAILLNTIFRNILLGGSKLSVSAALSDNPYFRAGVFKNNGWKPGYGLNFESNMHHMFLYRESKKYSELNFSDIKIQLFTQSIFRNSYSLGAGIEFENSHIKPVIDPGPEVFASRNEFLNYYGFLNIDSYDDAFYPSSGIKVRSDLKLVTSGKEFESIIYLAGHFNGVINITDRINLIGHIGGGAVNGDSIPPQYMLYAGGMAENIINGVIPFAGLDYLEIADRNIFVAGTDLQMRFLKNIYLLLRANVGNHSHYFDNLFTFNNIKGGYGITLGYDSLIGPIEITLSKSADQNNLQSFTRIGFYF